MSVYAKFRKINKAFWRKLGKKRPFVYFLLIDLYYGGFCWVLGSLVASATFGKWDVTSLFIWLWGGTFMSFIYYQELIKSERK